MRVLLDTCALTEARNPKGDRGVRAAIEAFDDERIFLSVITMGEITKGIALLKESRRKRELDAWLTGLDHDFSDRILPVDRETCGIWGKITARAHAKGRHVPASDGLIAATALQHGLYVLTRNVQDFGATGVLILNPWSG